MPKGGNYAQVQHSIWTDLDFRRLTPDAKLLFLFGFTSSSPAHMMGLTLSSPMVLREAISVEPLASAGRLEKALTELAGKPMALYDWDYNIYWVVKRFDYASASPQWLKGAHNYLNALPQGSTLVKEFRKKYRGPLKGAS